MANPPKAKGTQGENEVVASLVRVGLPATRESTNKQSDDIHIDGWNIAIEVKNRRRWDLWKWIRSLRRVTNAGPWALFCIHGDRRTAEGREVGKVMVVDADFGAFLLALYYDEVLHPMEARLVSD